MSSGGWTLRIEEIQRPATIDRLRTILARFEEAKSGTRSDFAFAEALEFVELAREPLALMQDLAELVIEGVTPTTPQNARRRRELLARHEELFR